MKISQRLYVQIGIVVCGMVLLSGMGAYQTDRVYEAANFANINTVPSLIDLDRANDDFGNIRVATWQHFSSDDAAQRHEIHQRIESLTKDIQAAFDKYERDDIGDAHDKELLNISRAAFANYSTLITSLLALSENGQGAEARAQLLSKQALVGTVAKAINDHRQYNQELGLAYARKAKQIFAQANWIALGSIALIASIIAGIGISLVRRISEALDSAVRVAESVTNGDLTVEIEIDSDDEIGALMRALKEMSANLSKIITELRTAAIAIESAASEISAGNMDLSTRTEHQAGALEETASSMEELTGAVGQNADNARQASELAVKANAVAIAGGDMVEQVVERMGNIANSSSKITEIISVIDGIAFQTNILALNAAVEAARAGEQGRGFAVVASEVRNLAQRSAAAAKEIKTLIEVSSGQVEIGNQLVSKAGDVMKDVVQHIQRVSHVMEEITVASREQSHGIHQVNEAVTHMDESTQQNAALVEQAAAAAAALQDQAASLNTMVGRFRVSTQPMLSSHARDQSQRLRLTANE